MEGEKERLSILECLDGAEFFGPLFPHPETWTAWRSFLATLYALPMTEAELAIFRACTGREEPRSTPFHEAYVLAGRRGGKSRISALIAVYEALLGDWSSHLARGERAHIFAIATDKSQAGLILSYIKGILELFPDEVESIGAEEIRLRNRVTIVVKPCSYRASRGYSTAVVVCDELAFWRDENSANPAEDVINSILPGLLPGGLLLGISTPYAKIGYLYDAWKSYYGKDEDILVWKAPTLTMNPTYSEATIRRMVARDKTAMLSEYNADFREDIEAFLPEALIESVCRRTIEPPDPKRRYIAFIDPSGGSHDSMTLALAYREGEKIVVAWTEERRPPFDPAEIVRDFAEVLKLYGVSSATADRYGGVWPEAAFAKRGIRLDLAPMSASDLYLEFAPLLRMGRVELPDDSRLRLQLQSLERRPGAGGRDKVDHPPGGHDDLANAVAGAVVLASQGLVLDEREIEARMPVKQRKELPGDSYRMTMEKTLAEDIKDFEYELGAGVGRPLRRRD